MAGLICRFHPLLFAFFTTLYAISTVDAQKMGQMVMSMRASFDSRLFNQAKNTCFGQRYGRV